MLNQIIFNVFGNKVNLFENEVVNDKEAKEFTKSINAGFYLASAKINIEIANLFILSGLKLIDPNWSLESENHYKSNNNIEIVDNEDKKEKGENNFKVEKNTNKKETILLIISNN